MNRDSRQRTIWLPLIVALAVALPAQASLATTSLVPEFSIGGVNAGPLLPPPSIELLEMLDEIGGTLHDDYDVVPLDHIELDSTDLDRLLDLASMNRATTPTTVTD